MEIDYKLQFEIERFLYDEVELLDQRKPAEWLDLFSEDTHYWMPMRRTLSPDELDKEFTGPEGMAIFDDDKAMLTLRVKKLESGYSWSEDPPSRTRHMLSNVRLLEATDNEVTVRSNFFVYRTRQATEVDIWVGRREDVLRKTGSSWQIADRKIFLDQTTIMSKNLSNFF